MRQPTIRPVPSDITHFYRYSSSQHLDWLKPIILDRHIYVPTAKQLNDPREAKPKFADVPVEDIAEFLKRMFVTNNPGLPPERYAHAAEEIDWMAARSTAEQLLKQMSESFYSLTENTRIFSMSKRWDNMALWAKYADNHRGYCLEFANTGLFNAAREVIYDDTYQLNVTDPSHATFEWFFCKSPEWSNEEEVRLVLARMLGGPLFPIEPEWLSRIIIGKDMPQPERQRIQTWANQRVPELMVMTAEFDSYAQKLKLRS
jgi:hypothetical protein